MTRPPYDPPTETDIAQVSAQLGREARGVIGIAARASDGSPAVVATSPRLPDGSPFPTFYYLCHPEAVAAASRLEAVGTMVEFTELLAADPEIRAQYEAAHEAYIADRETAGEVAEIAGISAGGMPTRVKCLHALIGHALAAGPGVNPIGDLALERSGWERGGAHEENTETS